MKCPYCGQSDTGVVDSRLTARDAAVRRRRECPSCRMRFTTYERFESPVITVVKRDGSRQAFDREKIRHGILMACEKRPVTDVQVEAIVRHVEDTIRRNSLAEVESKLIGSVVLEELREVDEVAYLRFASVCRGFQHVDEFIHELVRLRSGAREAGLPLKDAVLQAAGGGRP